MARLLAEVARIVQTPSKTIGCFSLEAFSFAIAFAFPGLPLPFPFPLPLPLWPFVKRRELLPLGDAPFPLEGCNL